MDPIAAARTAIQMVYGEPVLKPSGEEFSAARRVMSQPGMTVETVRLMMLIVGTSDRWWGPMFETACARGYGMRKFEEQLQGLRLALKRDPSAPGNRAAAEAYVEKPKTDEDRHIAATLNRTFAEKVAAVQQPFGDLIDAARANGLRGTAMFDWVMTERAKQTGRDRSDYPISKNLARGIAKAPGEPVSSPRHWTESEEARPDGDD